MIINETKLRKVIRAEISKNPNASEKEQLNEILGALKQMWAGLKQMFSGFFSKAETSYREPSHLRHAAGVAVADLKPKENAYDQVYLLSRVIWHVGSAIDMPIDSLGYAKDNLADLELPTDEETQERFSEGFTRVSENIAEAGGHLRTYLSKSGSGSLEDIGLAVEPAEKASEILVLMAEAIKQLEAKNPTEDWEKVIGAKAVTDVLEGEDTEAANNMRTLINSVAGDDIPKIQKIGTLKNLVDEVYQAVLAAEESMNAELVDAGEKPEESELLDHMMIAGQLIPESQVRTAVKQAVFEYFQARGQNLDN